MRRPLGAVRRRARAAFSREREWHDLQFGAARAGDRPAPARRARPSPASLPALFAAAAARARARPASTASSSTTRTPTRWRRSCRRSTRATTATAGRARTACGCRSRCSRPCVRASARRSRSAAASSPTRGSAIEGGKHGRRRRLLRRRVRARRHRLPVALARRQVRGRQAAEGRLGGLSVHRSVGLRVHADGDLGRARAVRPQRRGGGAIRAAVRAAGFATPVVVAGGISSFAQAEAAPRVGRRRHRRRRAPVARRSRLVPEDAPRPRRRGPPLHLLELLRRARPDAQAGHLPALGPRGARRAGDPEVARRPAAPRRARLVAGVEAGRCDACRC